MNFLNKYNNNKNIRFPFFKKSIELAVKRNLKIIVETGTSRGKEKFFFFKKMNWKDGMSTLMFADFAHNINGELHSCDISQNNINNAISFTKDFKKNTFFYVCDSVQFLRDFNKKIDLLYLDSFDGHDVELASKHQLNEAKEALSKLSDKSLVLLDDKGAKTIYSINFFNKNGFSIIGESANQVLMSKQI